MQIDELLELAKSRRTCRRFKPGPPIPEESITKMLEMARWAQSGANGQPWEFIVVRDPETLKKMNEIAFEARVESYIVEQTRMEEYRHQAHAFGSTRLGGMEDASVVIVVMGDRRVLPATALRAWMVVAEGGEGAHYAKNIGNATQYLHLAAAALGLATRWVSVQRGTEQQFKRLLNVPDAIDIHTLIPVGYRANKPPPPYRRELSEFVHYEKYDTAKYRTTADIIKYLASLRKRSTSAYKQGH